MNGIRVCSFNCRGIKSSIDEIKQLCEGFDFILLQETWLYKHELSYVFSISNDHYGKAISSIDTDNEVVQGRPHGGLAILWRKELANMCTIVEHDDTRFLSIVINNGDKSVQLVNVYFPYDSIDNADDFMFCLAKADSIVCDADSPYVYICGDFNSNVLVETRFGKELKSFCNNVNLVISDLLLKPEGMYTYLSDAHHSVSWLDHIVTTCNGHELIHNVCVDNSFISSDHFPLSFDINIRKLLVDNGTVEHNVRTKYKIKWDELSAAELNEYTRKSDVMFNSVYLNHDLLLCDNPNCDNIVHHKAIEVMYDAIIDALLQSGEDTMHECKTYENQIFGWNSVCKEVHATARDAFLTWVSNDKPKHGPLFDCMKRSRASFKYVLRQCKTNDSKAKADNLARKFLSKDCKSFWTELKRLNGSDKSVLASTVNGVSGHGNIANMWHDYYKKLLNSTSGTDNKKFVMDQFKICNTVDFEITPVDVKEAIKDLKSGKSAGLDNLTSEHFKYASDKLYVLLCLVINSMLTHGFLPSKFMDTLLIPIVKDKKGNITDGDNYRPIAITCVASKVFELIILDKCSDYFVTTDNQFGFKNGLSTELCIFSLKQIIEYYKMLSSPVYICYLDASKAFDRLNHWTLCKKLILRNVPIILVRLLSKWFSTQTFAVQWGSCVSNSFNVCNGVRQGGILSPIFFNVYIDDLSTGLTNLNIGCNFNDVYVNHLVYADDTVLIAPSPSALQELINYCSIFAKDNDIIYNLKKTKCMYIKPKWLNDLYFPGVYLNDSDIQVVNKEKYLGAFILDNAMDDEDMCRQMRSIYARGNALIKNFKNCTIEIKAMLFKTYCNGFYCSSLWSNYKVSSYKKIRVAYNNVFRGLMGLGRRDSTTKNMIDMCIDPFTVVVRKYIVSFITRLQCCNNLIVKTLYNWADFNDCKLFMVWRKNAYCATIM